MIYRRFAEVGVERQVSCCGIAAWRMDDDARTMIFPVDLKRNAFAGGVERKGIGAFRIIPQLRNGEALLNIIKTNADAYIILCKKAGVSSARKADAAGILHAHVPFSIDSRQPTRGYPHGNSFSHCRITTVRPPHQRHQWGRVCSQYDPAEGGAGNDKAVRVYYVTALRGGLAGVKRNSGAAYEDEVLHVVRGRNNPATCP